MPSDLTAIQPARWFITWIFSSLAPAIYLLALRWLSTEKVDWGSGVRNWAFSMAILLAALGLTSTRLPAWLRAGLRLGILAGGASTALFTLRTLHVDVAWVALASYWTLWIALAETLSQGFAPWIQAATVLILAGLAGSAPVLLVQVQEHFSEEEIFAALSAAVLTILWLLLWGAYRLMSCWSVPAKQPATITLRLRQAQIALWAGLLLASIFGLGIVLPAYQASFYPPEAPQYRGITPEQPFLCSQVPPDLTRYEGEAVFRRILEGVAANPERGAPEFGMLALGTGERSWAEAFRRRLLEEARQKLFTGPSNSFKADQYFAALRAYYYPRVTEKFPALFTAAEEKILSEWFWEINRRAQTVEWVDWLYAVAFAKLPDGPYENQEIGAGLLAILEASGLADPTLSLKNRQYLELQRRGWAARFRNTDDAYFYQPVWMMNANFQSFVAYAPNPKLQLQSFEWLLLQSLPSGAPAYYNLPFPVPVVNAFYLGALITGDPRYIWLAGRSLDHLAGNSRSLDALPGVETAINLAGISPTSGSCLMYGNSGLPNRPGPLAPDKIVLRDGWDAQDSYLMLNLRFSGWHRYKAPNTITRVDQAGPWVMEQLESQEYAWLPRGRSLVRDKRIPRENLNGILIERAGMSAVLQNLTAIGSPYAQNPPFYARVLEFKTSDQLDVATTVLENWNGWTHWRKIIFYHHGPLVVLDWAAGPPDQQALLTWHLASSTQARENHLSLQGGDQPVEMILLPGFKHQSIQGLQIDQDGSNTSVRYIPPCKGGLSLATVFLSRDWVGAEIGFLAGAENTLQIAQGTKVINIPLDMDGQMICDHER